MRASRLAPLLVAALAVGVALGVAAWRRAHRVVSDVITRPAPELGEHDEVLVPDLDGAVVVVPDRPHDPAEARAADRFARVTRLRRFTVRTNSLGLRGPEVALPAPAFRVLCAGDSVTFGWGVAEDLAFPARLAAVLGVEVLNAGVPAMKPPTIARWLAAHARDLDVDLVLFVRRPDWSAPGDPWQVYTRAVQEAARAVQPAPLGVVLPPVSTFDPQGSQRWQEEAAVATARLAPIPALELTPAFRAALPRPGVVMEQAQGRQRVVRLPDETVLVDAAAPARGLAPEVVAAFEAQPDLAEPLFFDGGHPDAAGYALFAETVARWVREQGWLPP